VDAYGEETFARLQVKRRWDPENACLNANIPPASD
jgi:hypothetical protein